MLADDDVGKLGDPVLFDVDLVQSQSDPRSVGELLRDIDREARELLFDVRPEDAAGLIRGWPALVDAAWSLWQAIPGRAIDDRAREDGDQPILRPLALSKAVALAIDSKLWPRAGPGDSRFGDWTTSLGHAARLVTRYAAEVTPENSAVHRDLETARTRLLHGLFVANHATLVALHERSKELRERDTGSDLRGSASGTRPYPNLVSNTGAWIRRLAMTERSFSVQLRPRLAGGLDPVEAEGDAARLERALVHWDLRAHRVLVRDPSPANVHLACRVHVLIHAMARQTLGAVLPTGDARVDMEGLELSATLESSARAWTDLADRWRDMVFPTSRVARDLTTAAGELRTAISGLQPGRSAVSRDDGPAHQETLRRAIGQGLDAIADLSTLIHDLALNPDLTGDPRVMSRRAQNDTAHQVALGVRPDIDTVWVTPRAVTINHPVPLPEPVWNGLKEASRDVVRESAHLSSLRTSLEAPASSRSLSLSSGRHMPPVAPPATRTRLPGGSHGR